MLLGFLFSQKMFKTTIFHQKWLANALKKKKKVFPNNYIAYRNIKNHYGKLLLLLIGKHQSIIIQESEKKSKKEKSGL